MITYASKFLCPQCSSALNNIGDNLICPTCAYTIPNPYLKNDTLNFSHLVYELSAVSKELQEIKGLIKDLVEASKTPKVLKD